MFAARFLHDFSKCGGVEILEGLADSGDAVLERYHSSGFSDVLTDGGNVELVQGSMLEGYDWSDGDVIFANSTCFDDILMEEMGRRAELLQPGAFVVTFTKGLTNPTFEVLERRRYKMSWGPATVYFHRRLNPDGTSVGGFELREVPDDDDEYDSPEVRLRASRADVATSCA